MATLKLNIETPTGCGKCPLFESRGVSWGCSAIPDDPPRVNSWENYDWRENHRLEHCPIEAQEANE